MNKIIYTSMKDNIFNKQNISDKNRSVGNTEDISRTVDELFANSERAVPDYGDFGVVKKDFLNKDKNLNLSDITLSIKPSVLLDERPKERELEIAVTSGNRLNKFTTVLLRGDKDSILSFLKDPAIISEIEDFMQEANEKFENLR